MKAIWNGVVIAEAPKEDLIFIERNWYFPPSSVNHTYLRKSDTPYTCHWKGVCQFYDVGDGDTWNEDNAFAYPEPDEAAIQKVKKDFSGYIAFWRNVSVTD